MSERMFDVLIAGAGLVGLSLARALSGAGLRIGLVEPRIELPAPGSALETRNLALARASVLALQRLGALPGSLPGHAIGHIHVSSQGQFGAARLHAKDHGVDWFGRVFPAERLLAALDASVTACADVQRFSPASVQGFEIDDAGVRVTVRYGDSPRILQTRLLVAADGSDSLIRDRLGIDTHRHDYASSAVSCNLRVQRGLEDWAFERMQRSGPLALLPLGDGMAGLVWTVPSEAAQTLSALPDPEFIDALQSQLGWRFGRVIEAGARRAYPLRLCVADLLHAERVVLVGNAAQSVHPLGAQGFNLGLRDALDLAAAVRDAHACGGDPGDGRVLADYAQGREPDRQATVAQSDGLLRLFAQTWLPVSVARMLGLIAFDRIRPLQHDLVMGSMGYRGQRSTLGLSTWQ